MRHTFATRLFENNVPAKTISKLLGHTSVAFTLDTYAHVLPDKKLQAIKTLQNIYDNDQLDDDFEKNNFDENDDD
jgi:integrase